MGMTDDCRRAFEFARGRGLSTDTLEALKHCAGEVLEAVEAYARYKGTHERFYGSRVDFVRELERQRQAFAGELADVVMCVYSVCGKEGIDIEGALEKCFLKNEARCDEADKDDID